jgi:hypothetical protein
VATADPDADDGVEADDEPDDEDEELADEPDEEVDDEPDDELVALVAAAREVPDAALLCAEAGKATAIAAAAAALTTPVPAVTAASLARPRRLASRAADSASPAGSCSVDMITPVHRRSVEHLRHPASPPRIKGECPQPQRLR